MHVVCYLSSLLRVIVLCGLFLYVLSSYLSVNSSSLSAPKPSHSQREHMAVERERQQANVAKAALVAEEARKNQKNEKRMKKDTVGQAFAKIEEEKRRKESLSRGSRGGGYNHLLGQQSTGYRPARKTARRG